MKTGQKSIKIIFTLVLIFFSFFSGVIYGQALPVDTVMATEIKKEEKKSPVNAEKKAWELMRMEKPRTEKSPELRAYEEMLVRMKSGAAQWGQVLAEFESYSLERKKRRASKN